MKNKKGFTLVELLAVIAILAILVIIALPNIMNLFNNAKKESFTNEVKNIFKTAEQQWMSDSMFDTNEKVYAKCSSGQCPNQLKLSGRDEINYYIKLDKAGNVVEYYIEDGTYQYAYNGNGLAIENIEEVDQVADLNSNEILTVSCDGGNGSEINKTFNGIIYRDGLLGFSPGYIGDSITEPKDVWCIVSGDYDLCDETTYLMSNSREECEQTLAYARTSENIDEETQALAQTAECKLERKITFPKYTTNMSELTWHSAYLKHDVVNGVVTTVYLCPYYEVNGVEKTFCVKGYDPSAYGNETTGNVSILKSLEREGFECSFSSSESRCSGFQSGDLVVQSTGRISYNVCQIYPTGETFCD